MHKMPEARSLPNIAGYRISDAASGVASSIKATFARLLSTELAILMAEARDLRDRGHGRLRTFSPKVFIPLTHLCRDVCHYCTFARPPRPGESAYLDRETILALARAGRDAGCTEALFTLGEKPELRYAAARQALSDLGHETTVSYLAEVARLVLDETGLLPHVNPGTLSRDEIALLKTVSVSQGMMLESASDRLCQRGGPHYGSPDKTPANRLATIELAGELRVPFTSGVLIGIGETRIERLEALNALRALHERHGHIQEIIVQNFRAKPRTKMAEASEPDLEDLLWTLAAARIIFGPDMHIQAPPNLAASDYPRLLDAGIDDWGGISPVTIDYVNPEAPWPHLAELRDRTANAGGILVPRLPLYPDFVRDLSRWVDPALVPSVLLHSDADGFAREDRWMPGDVKSPPTALATGRQPAHPSIVSLTERATAGCELTEGEVARLFAARGEDFVAICNAADALRRQVVGDTITYIVTRNINYTNICRYHCHFCAFSKGSRLETLGDPAYDLDLDEVVRRTVEAWDRGATEVCMQGGIHPRYTGQTYLDICRAAREAVPGIHIHAFSPLEICHGAESLGLSLTAYLEQLRDAGLSSLPGTAAEILDDGVRAEICPDKLSTAQWLAVVEAAHRVGLRTTSTMMFGHVERYEHWARHLLALRHLQQRTGGLTEFVPLPFVPMEAPMTLRGRSRHGPTFREAVLMHAISRLVLHPLVPNIQVSWVKMGIAAALRCLQAGASDFGGTLMNESISRAAGAQHGQEFSPAHIEATIRSLGRTPQLRTTLYSTVSDERRARAFEAGALSPLVLTLPKSRVRLAPRLHTNSGNFI